MKKGRLEKLTSSNVFGGVLTQNTTGTIEDWVSAFRILQRPDKSQIDEAAAEVPLVLRTHKDRDAYIPRGKPDPSAAVVAASELTRLLVLKHHDPVAARWAVYELTKRGFLAQETAVVYLPLVVHDLGTKKAPKSIAGNRSAVANETCLMPDLSAIHRKRQSKPGPVYCPRSETPPERDPSTPESGIQYFELRYPVVWATKQLWDWWRYSPPATLSLSTEDVQDDGPFPPDGFRFRKVTRNVSRPKVWKLIDYLWRAPGRTAEFADLAEPVWGDHEESVDKSNLGSLRRDANHFFEEHGWPYRVQIRNGYASLIGSKVDS